MKLNENWLREWVNPALTTAELVEQITMAGLEVDAVEPVAAAFSGVIVGEIVAAEPHPNADKLRVCQVSDGAQTVQVVCGAPNAGVGLKAPFATVGALLPGDFKINKAKLRQVESFGMLCAEQELGLAESSDGLMVLPADAPTGADIRQYLGLDDNTIEVDLTPNRADCLSVAGIAREVALLNRLEVNAVAIEAVAANCDDVFAVRVEAPAACPRYVGRVIRNIDSAVESPLWLQERLRRCGLRSIDPVVDVTNYVLLELGQPMHAFDLAKLHSAIVVRPARAGETLTLLDGQELALREGSLLIADEQAPLALAGIMGGQDSAVGSATRDIFLESAFFAPLALAGQARSYGLHTDSSHRFERGVDPQLQRRAIERATALLLSIVGGEPGPVIEVVAAAQLPQAQPILLREARIEQLLGLRIEPAEVLDILQRLGMQTSEHALGWQVTAPSWRFDIAIEADLLEELARVYGYNRLPVARIQSESCLKARPESKTELGVMRGLLLARGYQEAISYSFVEPRLQQLLFPAQAVVSLQNPISADMSVMRSSLWPGLLQAMSHNLKRQQPRVRLFESGLRFLPVDGALPHQERMLAGVITGSRLPESWHSNAESVDFYDLKGDVEALLALACGAERVAFVKAECSALHPGQTAEILLDGQPVGVLGTIHPQLQRQLDLVHPVYLFEINLSALADKALPSFTELSKYPEVRRDLAIIVDRDIEAERVLKVARAAAGELLDNLRLFDIYQGKGIDPKRKSLAFGLTFRHSSRTLNEEEVNASVATVVDALHTELGAILRN